MSSRWHDSWREGRIGFHKSEVHADLIEYEERFLGSEPKRVLVPLCGKTVDLAWLAQKGHEVIGVELVEQAVDEFFEELGAKPIVQEQNGARVLRHENLTLWNGDVFDATKDFIGTFDAVWDRAALVALPPDVRGPYVHHLRSLAKPGARLLQNLFEYDQSKMDGPPFSVPDDEFRSHYEGADIELLSELDGIESAPQFKERGHAYWFVRNYLVTL